MFILPKFTLYMPGPSAVTFEITLNIDEGQFHIQQRIIRRYRWKRKEKNLLNRRAAIKTTAKSMKGQQGWKETKGVRTVSGGQVQQLTQKKWFHPSLQNCKKKSKTDEGWKYPTSPGSFPEICVRSRTITVWNESDHWLKLIPGQRFLYSSRSQRHFENHWETVASAF